MSLFGAPAANPSSLFQMKAGKATLAGTTVTSDARKGLLVLRKSEDGLMHLIWQDRTTGTVEDDLIVFPGDASLRHLPAAKDGFTMLLEFTTGRKLFFWSQETRKKGLDWTKPEDIAKETEMMNKANTQLSGNTGPAPAATPAPSAGFGGMSHAELMAMLSGPAVVPAASTPAAPAAAPSDAAPAPETPAAPAPAATPATPAAATPAPASGFSADAISSILSGISVPPAAAPAAPPAAGGFSASSISSILGNIAAQGAPVALNEVIRPESTAPVVDAAMEARLAEHLPPAGDSGAPESVAGTLSTPQLQQAAARFTEALNQGEAQGLIAEMGLNPSGLGVEPFLRSLQAASDASGAATASSGMDVDGAAAPAAAPPAPDGSEKMDES